MTYADPIHVYVDGSYGFKTGRAAYGWVVANGSGSILQARVVQAEVPEKYGSSRMEAAAFIDAVAEFACRRRPIVIHGDCQDMAYLIDNYRAGRLSTSDFFKRKHIREEDAWKLMRNLDADFTFEWVKGHSRNFHNSVVDQMLRIITVEKQGEDAALYFANSALASGEAVIYGPMTNPLDAMDYVQGFSRISA